MENNKTVLSFVQASGTPTLGNYLGAFKNWHDMAAENDCIMEDKFKERVEGFFKFTDRNNCKRVYDWLIKH